MSNPNQFNSPQNPSGPGQVPPHVGPSQYNYPSNQGADSQQAPGYPYPQYGQPYQAPAGAASYAYAQRAPSPGE